jgi:hypothetical protein
MFLIEIYMLFKIKEAAYWQPRNESIIYNRCLLKEHHLFNRGKLISSNFIDSSNPIEVNT